ncbi:MAG: SURF1 family protein [Bosea sp.]|nr:SURF1 family protein [Bosea sp. (in: a-proteobacteria)]
MAAPAGRVEGGPPSRMSRFRILALAGLLTGVFVGLGLWQIERRSWKLDLIARVDARIHAQAVPAPGPGDWPGLEPADAEYRKVALDGVYLPGPETLVKAVTVKGPGFWVLAPFRSERGFTVLVNRGFVPEGRSDPSARSGAVSRGRTHLAGLLRLSEPGGGFLRSNDPAGGRWYSRDVAAIAQARGLGTVAPYFVDADAESEPGPRPLGGLTVVSFRNTHLIYALTWFCLAGMSAWAGFQLLRRRPEGEKEG